MDRVPEIWFRKCHGEMGLRQVEQDFSSFFCHIFGIFDDISNWSAPETFVQLTLNPFLG